MEGGRHIKCVLLSKYEVQKEDEKTALCGSGSRAAVRCQSRRSGAQSLSGRVGGSVWAFSTECFPKAPEKLFLGGIGNTFMSLRHVSKPVKKSLIQRNRIIYLVSQSLASPGTR